MNNEFEALRDALHGIYTVNREIGRGGMATVYLATDVKHAREVALKVLHPELAAAVGHERFLLEIRTTAQLSHPHILPLLDSGEAAGRLYYVMPFVEGESLRQRLDRDSQLPLDVAVEIARDVASALQHAHNKGVVHRDIKPENIMLSGDEAVVADFGIAKAVTAAGGSRLTGSGFAVGTPDYMSPEQSMGSEEVDARSDMYSLGTVCFEMLAGEPPFTGPNGQAVIAKRLTTDVPKLSTVRDVPSHIEGAVRKALARAPADRWNSMTDFSAALRDERVRDERTQRVRMDTGVATTRASTESARASRRPVTLVAIGVGVAVLAVIGYMMSDRASGTSTASVAAPATSTPVPPATTAPPDGMVLVPGGTYRLFGGTCRTCIPAKTVTLDTFYIDRTEVTVAAYRSQPSVPRQPPATADGALPMTAVMWGEADALCRARGARTRLPTEQEWEAAARGTDARIYPWGNSWQADHANAGGGQRVAAVGRYPTGRSPVGAEDMIGNVWEWTGTEAARHVDGRRQYVFRGGAFDTDSINATALHRPAQPEAAPERDRMTYYAKTGFRCVQSLR